MEEDFEKSITFQPIVDIDYKKYGFLPVNNRDVIAFSIYKVASKKWRNLIKCNFTDFASSFYSAMKFDSKLFSSRKRKLFPFLKSIFEQENVLASLVMIKAVKYLLDQNKYSEDEIIEKIVRVILPNAGFRKYIVNNRYVWKIDDKIKFKKTIGKAFVLNYINNKFDKDSVWKWVKKHCYRKTNGMWVYKNEISKERLLNAIRPFIKSGGMLVEDNLKHKFEAFIPLTVLSKDVSGGLKFVLAKDVSGSDKKTYYVQGSAANTNIDRDEERVSETFIAKMKKEAVGLPIFLDSHNPKNPDGTIGVIEKANGDKDSFDILGKLEDPSDNEYVKKVLNKMELGIIYGFSVGGRITKAFREYNDKLGKEVVVLADGQLHHVVLTNQPCNNTTFAEAMAKSLNEECIEDKVKKLDKIYSISHNSIMNKKEPDKSEILKTVSDLPDTAFPINRRTLDISKGYAHHFVSDGKLFLHKDLLVDQYKKALENNESSECISHLKTHLITIGLSKTVNKLNGLIKSVEDYEDIQSTVSGLTEQLKGLFKAVSSVKKLSVGKEEKMSMLKATIEDVSHKITKSLETIDIED